MKQSDKALARLEAAGYKPPRAGNVCMRCAWGRVANDGTNNKRIHCGKLKAMTACGGTCMHFATVIPVVAAA